MVRATSMPCGLDLLRAYMNARKKRPACYKGGISAEVGAGEGAHQAIAAARPLNSRRGIFSVATRLPVGRIAGNPIHL